MKAKIRIAIAGLAHIHASEYIECIHNNLDSCLIGVWDYNLAEAKKCAKQNNVPFVFTLDELIMLKPDLIVVCSENANHSTIVIDIAKAGIPMLCEKPLGITKAQMIDMLRVCKDTNTRLMIAFPNRFVDGIIKIRHAIRAGVLGDILSIKATNRGKMPGSFFIEKELSGGGCMMDHIVHVADLLNWFFDEPAKWVFAYRNTKLYPQLNVEDVALVHMNYAQSIQVTLDASWSLYKGNPTGRDLTMDILGTQGSVHFDIANDSVTLISEKYPLGKTFDFASHKNQKMIDAAVYSVKNNLPFPVTGEDGYKATMIALCAIESCAGNTPVKVKY